MDPIEEKLKRAMKRVDPPEGFMARVMARLEAQPPAAKSRRWSPWLEWLWASWRRAKVFGHQENSRSPFAYRRGNETLWTIFRGAITAHPVPAGAMVVILLGALGTGLGHWRRQAPLSISEQEWIAGRKASAQLMFALEITGARLSQMHALLAQPPSESPTAGAPAAPPEFRR